MAYKAGTSTCLGLQIPREAGVNKQEVAAYEERQAKRRQLQEQGASDAAEGQVGSRRAVLIGGQEEEAAVQWPRRQQVGCNEQLEPGAAVSRASQGAFLGCTDTGRPWAGSAGPGILPSHLHALRRGMPASYALQEEEEVLLQVPFAACLETFAAEQVVEDYMSAAAGKKTTVRELQPLFCFP